MMNHQKPINKKKVILIFYSIVFVLAGFVYSLVKLKYMMDPPKDEVKALESDETDKSKKL